MQQMLLTFTSTFMHLADAFIQSDFIFKYIFNMTIYFNVYFFISVYVPWEFSNVPVAQW